MEFEFDPIKSASNKLKHGIDFIEAQELWKDSNRVTKPTNFSQERRYWMVGKIGNKHWTTIFTYRNAIIRLISVRRSGKNEVKAYEEK